MHRCNAEKYNRLVQPCLASVSNGLEGDYPRMVQNRFQARAKAGTIAPFFIKALVLG